jgi:hypothetical protein
MPKILYSVFIVLVIILITYSLWVLLISPGFLLLSNGYNLEHAVSDPRNWDKSNVTFLDDSTSNQGENSDEQLFKMYEEHVRGTNMSESKNVSLFVKFLNKLFGRRRVENFDIYSPTHLKMRVQKLKINDVLDLYKLTGNKSYINPFIKGDIAKAYHSCNDVNSIIDDSECLIGYFVYVGPNSMWEYVGSERKDSVNNPILKSKSLSNEDKLESVKLFICTHPTAKELLYKYKQSDSKQKKEIIKLLKQHFDNYGSRMIEQSRMSHPIGCPIGHEIDSCITWNMFPDSEFGSRKKSDKRSCPFNFGTDTNKCLIMWNSVEWNIPKILKFEDGSVYNFNGHVITQIH